MKKPELLAPGGSFLSAFYAFEAGADGVYLGLKEFSARKAAQNFSLEQLRRIRRLAADRGKRLYVTINTIVRDAELPRLSGTLAWLEALSVDGVIVQDLGVCDMIRKRFPRISLHASTQMAVHDEAGLRMAKTLGIRRVILSRELPLERIRALREAHPDMELEVFIHGALCYSFSGVCLASGVLTGRSGNRGDCAQICRSLFSGDEPDCREGHFFSCRDLFLGREILKLAQIGIDALKIEGRMKSPEYVYNVTRLYREILDRGSELPEEEYAELMRRAETSFSREKTTGWLYAAAGSHLVETGFPGHRGSLLGAPQGVRDGWISLRLSSDLSLHDGLGIFPHEGEPVLFSVSFIRKAGQDVRFARAGSLVTVMVPPEGIAALSVPGVQLRQLSSRFLDLPQPKEEGFPLYKIPLTVEAGLSQGGVFTARIPGFPDFTRTVTLDKAHHKRPFAEILEGMLRESGDSAFTLGALSFLNGTGLADEEIFVPPSDLKKAKNELYAFLDASFLAVIADGEGQGWPAAPAAAEAHAVEALPAAEIAGLTRRDALTPPASAPIPFVCGDPSSLRTERLVLRAGFRWLPLPPVTAQDGAWQREIAGMAARDPEARFAVGINNLSHLELAAALVGSPNVWFFVDFSLYVANRGTLSVLQDRVPRLLFAYSWIEDDERGFDPGPGTVPCIQISRDFHPPLFYSLGCFARHVLNNGTCDADCPKDFSRELRQGRNRFHLIVRDCVTYLFARGSSTTATP
jgi:U32 family peptidase